MKIIDPNCVRDIPWHKMQALVDVMAMGLTNNESSVISKQFSLNVMRLLELEGCVARNERDEENRSGDMVSIARLESLMREGVIDPELFNQVVKQDCLFVVKSSNYTID